MHCNHRREEYVPAVWPAGRYLVGEQDRCGALGVLALLLVNAFLLQAVWFVSFAAVVIWDVEHGLLVGVIFGLLMAVLRTQT